MVLSINFTTFISCGRSEIRYTVTVSIYYLFCLCVTRKRHSLIQGILYNCTLDDIIKEIRNERLTPEELGAILEAFFEAHSFSDGDLLVPTSLPADRLPGMPRDALSLLSVRL